MVQKGQSVVYGDTKTIKADPDLKHLGGASKVRRTQKDDLMFELKKSSLGRMSRYRLKSMRSI